MKSVKRLTVQVSVKGKGVHRLSRAALSALVLRWIDEGNTFLPKGLEVRVMIWRHGRELDWQSDDPRSERLREMIRGLLQRDDIEIRIPGTARDKQSRVHRRRQPRRSASA